MARQLIIVRVRSWARSAGQDATETNLVEEPADEWLDDGKVGYNDRYKCLTAGPSTAGDGTGWSGLQHGLA